MGRTLRRISSSVIALLLVIPLGASCAERGATSIEDATARYLAAARRGDVSAIVGLAPADFDAEAEARAKVAAYALIRDAKVDTVYQRNDITPNELGVDFVANGGAFKDSIRVQRLERRWYVMIGQSRRAPPEPTAQATR